jgi:hypothetical protein
MVKQQLRCRFTINQKWGDFLKEVEKNGHFSSFPSFSTENGVEYHF